MKIVLDIQGMQTASKFRGIGRHTLELAKGILRNKKEHQIVLTGNALFQNYDEIFSAFSDLISRNDLSFFDSEGSISHDSIDNDARRHAAEVVRCCHIAHLHPDVVHVFSPIEGAVEQNAGGIIEESWIINSATLHDLIPYVFADKYLQNTVHAACYYDHIRNLMRMDVLLAISKASKADAINFLNYPDKRIFCISSAAPVGYGQSIPADANTKQLGIFKPYILTVGIFEFRKNIDRLLQAYAQLPSQIRDERQLVLACQGNDCDIQTYQFKAAKLGLKPGTLVITRYLTDAMLLSLYASCELFVFPSLYEGFGLPALEAMLCGAPVLAADTSSLPEVMGMEEALFDPYDVQALSDKMLAALTDANFRHRLLNNSLQRPITFSWDKSAQLAIEAWEKTIQERGQLEISGVSSPTRPKLAYVFSADPGAKALHTLMEHVIFGLAAHYDVFPVAIDDTKIESARMQSLGGIKSTQWLLDNTDGFERVVYHIDHLAQYDKLKDCMADVPGLLLLGAELAGEEQAPKEQTTEAHKQYNISNLDCDEWLYESLGYTPFANKFIPLDLLNNPVNLIGWAVRNARALAVHSCKMKKELCALYDLPEEHIAMLSLPLEKGADACKIYDMSTHITHYLTFFQKWIEDSYAQPYMTQQNVIRRIAASVHACTGTVDVMRQGAITNTLFDNKQRSRQLFIDVSEIEHTDAHTGIQRVTRALLKQLFKNPPEGYRVEPVYASPQSSGYCYARKFTFRFLGIDAGWPKDTAVSYGKGDVFFGLDLQAHTVVAQHDWLYRMRSLGVQTYFVVHDLLPVQFPQFFWEGTEEIHEKWLRCIHDFDGALCVSRNVAEQLGRWYEVNIADRNKTFQLAHFHHGADINDSVPTTGSVNQKVLERMKAHPSFLMVGTVERRKNHVQMLDAMEILWENGSDALFVIVGKKGWLIDEFTDRLKGHQEANNRLLWLQNVSDEYLQALYKAASGVVMTSFGEGFGLPIVEAAQNGTPLILRDLPVFKEIAGEHAWYFSGYEPEQLATSLQTWLMERSKKNLPDSTKICILTWKESYHMVCNALLTMINRNNGN